MTRKQKKNPADALMSSVLDELKADPHLEHKRKVAAEPTAVLSVDSVAEATGSPSPMGLISEGAAHEKSELSLPMDSLSASQDGTMVVGSGASAPGQEPEAKTSFGAAKSSQRSMGGWGATSDAQILQAESLKIVQAKLGELEKELEKLREENEVLTSACEFARQQAQDMTEKLEGMEKARADQVQHYLAEIQIYKENLSESDRSKQSLKRRVEELQGRVQADLRKIRVRERELENRLEMARLERAAILKSKDDMILDLKAKMDTVQVELQQALLKNQELEGRIDNQQSQVARTVRALRLALTNLEASEKTDVTIVPLKKAD